MEEKSSAEQNNGKKVTASPFDNLSREDLVKKCRGLLGIAQKAKQAKDECHEENKKLREQLDQAEMQKIADKECLKAMQEMVHSLTEHKLQTTIRVDELEKIVASSRRELDGASMLRDKLEKNSDENEALKRQIQRLTDENDELLGNLTAMEERLKTIAADSQKIEQEKSSLEKELSKVTNNETVPSEKEEKLVRKLKLYKNKVQEISAKIMLLKSDRKILMKTVKEYSEQVPKWQKELLNASNVLFAQTQAMEKETVGLQEQCTSYCKQIEELSQQNEVMVGERNDLMQKIATLTDRCSRADQIKAADNGKHLEDVKSLEFQVSDLAESLKLEQAKNSEILQNNRETVDEQKQQIEKLSSGIIECNTKLERMESEKTDLLRQLASKEAELQKELHTNEQLLAKIDQLTGDSNSDVVEKRLKELEQIKINLELVNAKLSQEIQELPSSSAFEEIQERCKSQLQEMEATKAQISDYEQKFSQECQGHEESKACLTAIQKEFSDLQLRYQTQNGELEDRQNLLIQLEQKLQSAEASIDLLKQNSANDLEGRLIDLQNQLSTKTEALNAKSLQHNELEKKIAELEATTADLHGELDKVQFATATLQENISEHETKLEESLTQKEKLEAKILESNMAFETLRSSYDVLANENKHLKVSHEQLCHESLVDREELGTVRSKYELVKMENSELLSELKEINEILKERGGVISLQLSKISELESQKTALQQKLNELNSPEVEQLRVRLQELESAVAEKEAEINTYRDRDRNFDTQSDVMSTSTISRAEECARLREIDDSFEEKYNKLRSLAVKLKKKVAEQTVLLQKYEKEKEPVSLGKNLQSLQAEYDKLLDELEAERKNKDQSELELAVLREQLEKQRQEIETLNQVRTEVDNSKKDKSSLESTIREYREQLQSLKREKEAFNLAKKDIDVENQKLKTALKAKEKQLSDELEAQKDLKAEVERSRLAVKKANVLSLEMEAYEKSSSELNKKLESKKVQVSELEGTIETQEGTIKSLKSQIGLLEQSLTSERSHAQELKKNVDLQQEKLRMSEHQRGETNVELAQLKLEYEQIKLELESNRSELADAVNEKEKANSMLEIEKSKLLKQVYSVESESAELKCRLKEKEQEVEDVKTEFTSYKIRAQSVLKQNQNKDSGKERELEEEVQNLQKTLELEQNKLKQITQQLTDLSRSNEELKEDKTRLQSRCKELRELLEESRLQNESLLDENRNNNLAHQEALRTQRIQTETLVNCYKKQVEDAQEKYSKDMENLRLQLGKSARETTETPSGDSRNNNSIVQRGQHISDEQKISLLLMEREEGEGSESTSSSTALQRNRKVSNSSQNNNRLRSNRDLIPLDELLNSSFDDASVFDTAEDSGARSISPTAELQQTKEKLSKQESRVRHLTALLAEAEQDLAKLTQLNELLKEEVRRQERSIEREKHVHNSEYLKNVIFKFLTLNSGDEKSHLVPVLNTILKLSPEETQKLNNVAKGAESGGRGWTGILWN
ncbi:GRIP and coiled-coil domain-containing protein 2 [Malaya genurostris]|uniref:GRIP and coiled-coil domain-containing protein 2 n=1 Tax=Malaya genurostris TaxID=325434 RepID=UPI0026F3CEA8|nr:GRIP and coiled-coil domain-containing protein 2 [Malaya genurostris]